VTLQWLLGWHEPQVGTFKMDFQEKHFQGRYSAMSG